MTKNNLSLFPNILKLITLIRNLIIETKISISKGRPVTIKVKPVSKYYYNKNIPPQVSSKMTMMLIRNIIVIKIKIVSDFKV